MPRESRATGVLTIAPPPRGTMTEAEGERRVCGGAKGDSPAARERRVDKNIIPSR